MIIYEIIHNCIALYHFPSKYRFFCSKNPYFVTKFHSKLAINDATKNHFHQSLSLFLFVYCIVLYCIVLYCIVLYCIVLYFIAKWRKKQRKSKCYRIVYCITLYCIVLYCIVLYCIVLHCNVLYYIVLYCIVLHRKMEKKLAKITV